MPCPELVWQSAARFSNHMEVVQHRLREDPVVADRGRIAVEILNQLLAPFLDVAKALVERAAHRRGASRSIAAASRGFACSTGMTSTGTPKSSLSSRCASATAE
jgi:hypothetical protein